MSNKESLGLLETLWRNRERPKFGSNHWFRCWAKRVQQLPRLVKQMFSTMRLRRRGAIIEGIVIFADVSRISGDCSNLSIGAETFIGRVDIALHDVVRIGSRVCINDRTKLLTASHAVQLENWETTTAPIEIDDYAWIASDVIILPGVKIGRGAVVGAGAVVSKNVPAFAVAVGNPATIILDKRCRELDYSPVYNVALMRAWIQANSDASEKLQEA